MSNIRKTDVKNHMSPRFRWRIYLCEPEGQSDATGFPYEITAGADPNENHSIENPLHLSSTNAQKPIAIETSQSVQD